ncbi:MAG TPA: glucuronate isomerase [Clostridia bacterium]|nr:glucuronate isomerase [Clostridia bacterium]
MQTLIHNDFLLTNETARVLYHGHSEKMPVIDYHCHIDPKQIYEDYRYSDIAEVWLGADHYKWRVLRANGVEERLITGDASPYEKFQAWAAVVPKLIGNPLYHWTHLELARYFGIFEPLSPNTCKEIWDKANETLKTLTVRKIIERSNVTAICTTDDPADDLKWHKLIKEDKSFKTLVLPAFRPDKAVNVNKPDFSKYLEKLGATAGINIRSLDDVKEALSRRVKYFAEMGCLTADHGLDAIVCEQDSAAASAALHNMLSGTRPDAYGEAAYKTEVLLHLGRLYQKYGFVMQLHYGAVRDNNPVMYEKLGPDTGYDAIGGVSHCGAALGQFLGTLEKEGALGKTIVYSLNPIDNAQISTVIGCFQGAYVRNKMQHGSAWWFNDTKRGMEEQLKNLAESSVLPNFVGMLTDSRSFLSYTRHEYFRRILCNLLGTWVENGEYPRDMELLGEMVEDISYNNTVSYFGFRLR